MPNYDLNILKFNYPKMDYEKFMNERNDYFNGFENISEEEEYDKDVEHLDKAIAWEKEYSKLYLKQCVSDIKNVDREAIIAMTKQSVPHKIPFKMKFRRFMNKLSKTFGYGGHE